MRWIGIPHFLYRLREADNVFQKTTSANRYRGRTKLRQEAHEVLTPEEETAVEKWITRLDDIGISTKGLTSLPDSDIHSSKAYPPIKNQSKTHVMSVITGISRFLDQHPNIANRYSACIQNTRTTARKSSIINSFFNRLSEFRSQCHILPEATDNVDEKYSQCRKSNDTTLSYNIYAR